MFRRLHPLPLLLLALSLLAAIVPLARRYRAESRNRSVELVIDFNQLRVLASATGHPLSQALVDAKGAGISGAAVSEQLLQELVSAGRVRIRECIPLPKWGGAVRVTAAIAEPDLFERVRENFGERVPQVNNAAGPGIGPGVLFQGAGERQRFFVPDSSWQGLLDVPVGLDPLDVAAVRSAGLDLVARLYNWLGATPPSIRWSLQQARSAGATTIIFAGEEVMGFQRQLEATTAGLAEAGLTYGQVEFGKQRGDEALAERTQDRLVRVHSIAAGETARLTNEAEAIERYSRAVEERNIRLCYVRLMGAVTEDTYRDSLDYVRKISRSVSGSGFVLGKAHPLEEVAEHSAAGRVVDAALGAGIGAAGLLLLASLFPIRRPYQVPLTLLFAAFGAGMLLAGGEKGRQLVALGAALVFPTLAFVWLRQPVGAFAGEKFPRRPSAALFALAEFAAMCAISGAGALLVAATLSQRAYMLKVESFAGIKVAHVIPLLAVAAFYLLGLSNRRPWAEEREKIVARARAFLSEPLQLWHLVAMLVALVGLLLLVLRTGNDPGVGVSALEMKFRSLLEQHLVRPRTKEFMLGHPALMIGLAMAALPRWRRWALPFLLVGAIGQASIVNSFCHLHTPLATSAWRTFNGIWLGALLGLAALAAGNIALRLMPVRDPEFETADGRR